MPKKVKRSDRKSSGSRLYRPRKVVPPQKRKSGDVSSSSASAKKIKGTSQQTENEDPMPSTSSGPSTSTYMADYDDPASLLAVSYEQQSPTDPLSSDEDSKIYIKEEPLFLDYHEEEKTQEQDQTKSLAQDKGTHFADTSGSTSNIKQEMSEDEEMKSETEPDSKFLNIWSGKISVPSSHWTINKVIKNEKKIVSLLKLLVPKSGIPVIEKQIVITEDMHIKWIIFMKEIGSMSYFSEEFFENFIKHFESMKVCYGGPPNENKDSIISATYQYTLDHYLNVWRHKSCPLVIEDPEIQGNMCKFCATVVVSTNITDHSIIESKGTVLWRERFKGSQKEVRDLKQVNEDLQQRIKDLQKYIDSMLVD